MRRENIYVRMHHRIKANVGQTVTIGDVATITYSEKYEAITQTPICSISPNEGKLMIVDVMQVLKVITNISPHTIVVPVGQFETIVMIEKDKSRLTNVYFVLIWILLFIGAALAIMNFHEDVSMNDVHQRIYRLITGETSTKPLMLQIPYSFGLGLGMILFFNHFFKKRLSDEPSPLEIEMFQYEQALDQYAIQHDEKKMK